MVRNVAGRCWNCGGQERETSAESCGWCGVWLADLRPDAVPPECRPLLRTALRWGINDDGYRSQAVEQADRASLIDLVASVDTVPENSLYGWLAGPESRSPAPSREYVAITCLTMAADEARQLLRRPG